jgi:hypothetical protein
MALVFGEKNIPEPNPDMNIHADNSKTDVLADILTIPSKPIAEIKSPIELSSLEPYLSESHPLIGAIIIIDRANGASRIPDITGSIDFIP